jgi:predicted O-methyltransferase YrrM
LRYPQLEHSLAVPSHLSVSERVELFRLANQSGIRTVVEIGSYLGASALALAAGLKAAGNADAKVYCIDTWENFGMSEGERDTYAAFQANTAPFADRVVPIRGWSTAVAPALLQQVGRIDLLFIDGDHSYDGVLADWRTFGPALAPRAAVAFHDIGWAEGVQRVVNEEVRQAAQSQGGRPNLWWGRLG